MTATSSQETSENVTMLAETASNEGLIHESFYVNGYWLYTRPEFGWADALWANLVFVSLAGFRPLTVQPDDLLQIPLETVSTAPPLARFADQLSNGAVIYDALGELLEANDQNPNRR